MFLIVIAFLTVEICDARVESAANWIRRNCRRIEIVY